MAKGTERDEIAQFAARYAQGRVPAVLATERESVGSDYGATGYTTVAQADLLSDELGLSPGDRLLDIGSGCGWPGLHIAARTGCSVVVTDLTLPGVQRARDRAVLDAMGSRAAVAVANGRQLPFRPESFDAVVVADVLCWLSAKLSVLRACRRILRPGGRIGFLTILVADGLSARQRRRTAAVGPPAPLGPDGRSLAERAGFVEIDVRDVTADYLASARARLSARLRLRDEIRPLDPDDYDEMVTHGPLAIREIEAGRLLRTLVVARRPPR